MKAKNRLSVKDLAKRFGVTQSTVYHWAADQHLPPPTPSPRKYGKSWLAVDIDRWERDVQELDQCAAFLRELSAEPRLHPGFQAFAENLANVLRDTRLPTYKRLRLADLAGKVVWTRGVDPTEADLKEIQRHTQNVNDLISALGPVSLGE